ncbi:MAG TPA: ABC transporter six-transmembrane domain-containing protein [Bacteroidota bacterium]|nr:ABC transporter six-transmembrane domain-containing protein [Bacteroidota bacterium]
MHLLDLTKRFKTGIAIAISLVVVENVAWILEPSLFGRVIDALIDTASGEGHIAVTFPLVLWVGVFLINSIVGSARRSVDQKIFLKMFTEIAADVAAMGKKHRLSISKTAARAELSREYITFFQYRLPEILEQSIAIVGAVIALVFFDLRIAATCFAIVIPLLIITRFYNQKVILLQRSVHDTREEAYEIFSLKEPDRVKEYYHSMAGTQQKIANWGAVNFLMMRIFLLGIFLIVMYIAIDLDDFTTGNIYSIVAYLWTFVTSSEYLPELLESWTSLSDISQRLKNEEM